jgi:hypothetical protein
MSNSLHLPSTHDIRLSAENLGQTANDNVAVGQNLDIRVVAHSLVHNNSKVVFIG